MKEIIVPFPVRIKKFKKHAELKDKLLDAINRQENVQRMLAPGNDITRCDWETSRFDRSREWLSIIGIDLYEHLGEWTTSLGYYDFQVAEIWFQQYTNGSHHGWHVHGGNMTNVYYLDLPADSPKTEWINPIDNSIHQFDIEEGDIITFPSWLKHRAPINQSSKMKTIISWNLDVILQDGYGE